MADHNAKNAAPVTTNVNVYPPGKNENDRKS